VLDFVSWWLIPRTALEGLACIVDVAFSGKLRPRPLINGQRSPNRIYNLRQSSNGVRRGRAPRRKPTDSPSRVASGAQGAPNIEILVNVSNRETRIALLEDGKLMEYRVEREERVVGSIFKGIVQNVLPGMDAAFVDIGLERNAFLYAGRSRTCSSPDRKLWCRSPRVLAVRRAPEFLRASLCPAAIWF
jgi:hypothetical protein